MKNQNVWIEFRQWNEKKPYIYFRDLKDVYNDTSAYTTKIRGIKQAKLFLEQIFNSYELQEDLNFSDIRRILNDKFNLAVHTYCAMD